MNHILWPVTNSQYLKDSWQNPDWGSALTQQVFLQVVLTTGLDHKPNFFCVLMKKN